MIGLVRLLPPFLMFLSTGHRLVFALAVLLTIVTTANASLPADEKAPAGPMSVGQTESTGPDGAEEDAGANAPVAVRCTPSVGFAPLTVTFQTESRAPGEVHEVRYDFAGDQKGLVSKPDLKPVTHVYDQPGEFCPVVTVKTAAGSFSSRGPFDSFGLQPPLTIRAAAAPRIVRTINVTDPVDVAVAEDKSVYVLSRSKAEVTQYDEKGRPVRSLAAVGTSPCGIGLDSTGKVYVALTGDNQVIRLAPTDSSFTLDTSFNATGRIGNADRSAGAGPAALDAPYDVTVDTANHTIYVSDGGNRRIQVFSSGGAIMHSIVSPGSPAQPLKSPKGIVFCNLAIFAVDGENNDIAALDDDYIRGVYGKISNDAVQFNSPFGIDVDLRKAYVADTGNNRVVCFDARRMDGGGRPGGFQSLWAVSSELGLKAPAAVASGKSLVSTIFYVADTGNNRVIEVEVPNGERPDAVWERMRERMAAKDIEGALQCFLSNKVNDYREYFRAQGVKHSVAAIREIGPIVPVEIEDDTAEYRFDHIIQGQTVSFSIHFVKEKGHWKIEEF